MQMKTTGKITFALLSAVILFTLAGCGNFRRALYITEKKTQVWEQDGLVLALTFLDDATLLKRYGDTESNPFITAYNQALLRRIVPFELKIINNSPQEITISTRDSFCTFNDIRIMTYNQFEMESYWDKQDEFDSIPEDKRADKLQTMLRHQVDTYEVIPIGTTFNKVLTFVGDTQDIGTAKISIGILERNTKRVLTRCEFYYEFTDPPVK
ncbi:MAG: hypothetical protein JW904_08060 [Spirochaetales bacterium]|nr:hypothetical protein [Spirochaetales bacterium]